MKIASEILSGIPLNKDVKIVLDRYKAIKQGINEIKNDEVLLILGKGHEKYQEIDGKYIDFSDAKVVEEILDLEI
jgi:UDP-N-acetylmuramoyl-L-alanyl-D-glutamate--2,6-diaminopimelate ligase